MKRHHWTFLYVPANEGGVRTYHLDKRLVAWLAGALSMLAVIMLLITLGFVRQRVVLDNLSDRDREVMALRSELDELERTVRLYEDQMAQNFQLQERANLLAGLGPLESPLPEVGMGGHAPDAGSDLPVVVDKLSRERISEIRRQLNRLVAHARFQKDGYEQVLQALREDQRLRDTTPSIRPLRGGWLSSRYGRRVDPFTGRMAFHRGIDFSASIGTPIFATASGTVTRASRHGSLGNLVEIDHGNGFVSRYGHLNGFTVKKGDTVERGDIIGHLGNTGRSTGPHLHYEVVHNGRSENPWLYIIRD
jgi:murein DD-endopeptidase MepM/ murein hydrolase activator NlpD